MEAVKGLLSRLSHSLPASHDTVNTPTAPVTRKTIGRSVEIHSTAEGSKHALNEQLEPATSAAYSRPGLADRIRRNNSKSSKTVHVEGYQRAGDKKMPPFVFKRINTLGNVMTGYPRSEARANGHSTRPAIPRSLATQTSGGSNVPARSDRGLTYAAEGAKRRRLSGSDEVVEVRSMAGTKKVLVSVDLTHQEIEPETVVAVNGNSVPSASRTVRGLHELDPFQSSQQHLARPNTKKRRKSKDNTFTGLSQYRSESYRTASTTPERRSYGRRRPDPPPRQPSMIERYDGDLTGSDDILHGDTTVSGDTVEKSGPLYPPWSILEFHTRRQTWTNKNAPLSLRFDDTSNLFMVTENNRDGAPETISFDHTDINLVHHSSSSGYVSCRSPRYTWLLIHFSRAQDASTFSSIIASLTDSHKLRHLDAQKMYEHWVGCWKMIKGARLADSQPAEPARKQAFPTVTPNRRSTRKPEVVTIREPTPVAEKWSKLHQAEISKLFKYPVVFPKVGPRQVTIPPHDVERLDEGEFLNDDLIGYALRSIEEDMTPEDRQQVHIFNTFFYSALTGAGSRAKINYAKVKRWTRSEDLFAKPFIIVPINQNLHWYTAIIVNLNMLGEQAARVDDPGDATNSSPGPTDDIFQFGEDGNISKQQPTDVVANKRRGGPRRYDTKGPAIITLDSFGSTHAGEIRNLKEYVVAEAMDKKSLRVDIQDIRGITAKGIPEQSNFCDCGLYLIGYIRQFAKDPRNFVQKILERDDKALAVDFQGFSSSAERNKIRDELFELSKRQLAERAERKKLKNSPTRNSAREALRAAATPTEHPSSPNPRLHDEQRSSPKNAQPEVVDGHHAMEHDQEMRLGDTVPDSQER